MKVVWENDTLKGFFTMLCTGIGIGKLTVKAKGYAEAPLHNL